MDSLRYWVTECHVDGFRFDLASTLARDPHDFDRRSAFLDGDPPGSGALAGEADRRAVGSRPRRLPGRQASRPAGRSGTTATATRCATSGAAQTNAAAFAWRFTGSSDLFRRRGARAGGVDQLRHRPRRLHARRPRLLQRQAQRGEPRGQPRRARRQPLVELRRRGPDRRPRGERAPRAASSATSWRPCCCRRARRCCSAATSAAARRAATTTPGARTTRRRGSTGSTATSELLAFTRRLLALRRAPAGVPARRLPERRRPEAALPDAWWFRPDGRAMAQRDWQQHDTRELGVFLNGDEGDSFVFLLNPTPEPVTFRLPPRRFGFEWTLELSTARRTRQGSSTAGGRPSRSRPARSCSSAASGTVEPSARRRRRSRSWATAPPPKRWPFARQIR